MATQAIATTPNADVVRIVRKALAAGGEPMIASAILKQMPISCRSSKDAFSELLERAVADGNLWKFAPYRAKNPRYSDRPIEQYAKQVIVAEVSKSPVTPNDLNGKISARLRDLSDSGLKAVLRELIAERAVIELPPLPSSKVSRYSTVAPDPSEYLAPAIKRFQVAIEKTAALLSKTGVSREETVRIAKKLVGSQQSAFSSSADPGNPFASQANEATDDRIMEAITELRDASGSPLVPVADLRHSLDLHFTDKAAFDHAILALSRQGKVSLHRHDYPHSLSADDRETLVTDGQNFFSGIAIRK